MGGLDPAQGSEWVSDKNITSSVWWQEEALPCSLLAPHTDESGSPKE